ncbi:MAG: FHA domain-containing protein, partial [Nannocystaceae bacterium]|nr:FHA domain-containing protein [Nannocystaceae bacterium]
AARVFEYAGEHAQAAVLRMEHARTVRDQGERLDTLREGCARNPGTTPAGRALHHALAEALLTEARTDDDDPARQRGLRLEAARALEEADDGASAGELYEGLGLLDLAARAYERGGEIARLELVLAVLERRDAEDQQLTELVRQVDTAIADGQRREAHVLLTEHVARRERFGRALAPAVAQRLRTLQQARPRGTRLTLKWNHGLTQIHSESRFRIGRAPDCDLVVPGARLSRHHVELSLDTSGETGPTLVATDLGSKVGTFWDGLPLDPGVPEPIHTTSELGLGMAASVTVVPVKGPQGHAYGALMRLSQARSRPQVWSLYLPAGGPLVLAPEVVVPARLLFDRDWVLLDFASGVGFSLGGRDLAPGQVVELLLGDHLALADAPLTLEVVT